MERDLVPRHQDAGAILMRQQNMQRGQLVIQTPPAKAHRHNRRSVHTTQRLVKISGLLFSYPVAAFSWHLRQCRVFDAVHVADHGLRICTRSQGQRQSSIHGDTNRCDG